MIEIAILKDHTLKAERDEAEGVRIPTPLVLSRHECSSESRIQPLEPYPPRHSCMPPLPQIPTLVVLLIKCYSPQSQQTELASIILFVLLLGLGRSAFD